MEHQKLKQRVHFIYNDVQTSGYVFSILHDVSNKYLLFLRKSVNNEFRQTDRRDTTEENNRAKNKRLLVMKQATQGT